MTITTKTRTTTIEIEEMGGCSRHVWIVPFPTGGDDSHVFSPVCRRIRFHLSFSTSSNQSSSWTDKSRQTEKEEGNGGILCCSDIAVFFFLFFLLSLCWRSRGTLEQFGRPLAPSVSVDGYFSFYGWKISSAEHILITFCIIFGSYFFQFPNVVILFGGCRSVRN
jgi:hypothetical protein